MDPFERAEDENAMGYQRWYLERMFAIAPAGAYVGQWLQSFKEFPPRQKPGSFNLDRVMEAVTAGSRAAVAADLPSRARRKRLPSLVGARHDVVPGANKIVGVGTHLRQAHARLV